MSLPPGPRLPALLQTLHFMLSPEAALAGPARRYGDLYTARNAVFGPQVTVCDPELVKQVFTGDPAVFHSGEANNALLPLAGDKSIMLLDGPAHLRQRRLLMPPLHGERMHAYAEIMREATLRAIAGWREGEAVSLHGPMQRLTLEIILHAVFGLTEGARREELKQGLTALLGRIQSPTGLFILHPALQRDLGPLTPWAAFKKDRAHVDALIYAEIAERRRERAAPDGPRRDDVLSMLLDARDEEGHEMTDVELRDELVTLLIAGHETTATSLCWAFAEILGHPDVEARLFAEIDAAAPDGHLSPDALGRLEYLDATIKETLRLWSPVPYFARRVKETVTLRGYEIPPGTLVVLSIYNTHRRADLYPEPEQFKPERFVGKKVDPYAWFPFGGGIRRCLGMAFALQEMKIVLATVLGRVRLRLARRPPLKVTLRSLSMLPEGGTPVIVGGRR